MSRILRAFARGMLVASVAFPFATGAQAQVRVEGEVVDGLTGLPVRGVIVQFPDLGLATISDSMGYFGFPEIPRGSQILSTYHLAYHDLAGDAPIVPGDILVLKLTPRPIAVRGVDVDVTPADELEVLMSGRGSDYISIEEVEEMAGRTNKVLEVLRAKAPPRLQIQQQGGVGGVSFCIQSTRVRPSIQELKELGIGCRPAMLILDGTVVYSPPGGGRAASMEAPNLPSDVAWMLLNQDPNEIQSIRVLTGSEAFFRYGESGRMGAVEIKTRRPGRIR